MKLGTKMLLLKKLLIYAPPDESRDDEDVAAMKTMEDYLFNEDLANEIRVGGRESIEKMRLLHEGLKSTSPGYDYRLQNCQG